MGLIGWLLCIAGVGYFVTLIRKDTKVRASEEAENKRRKNTVCRFRDGLSYDEFRLIVLKSGKPIKRLLIVSIDGPVIQGLVRSQSGSTEWNFELDFNDYGHISGKYWVSSDNKDSNIPYRFGDIISSAIQNRSYRNRYAHY